MNEFKKNMRPESLMMSHGYKPELSQGAIKCPIFQTSTFVFESAEDGKAFFEVAYGLREKEKGEEMGLIYSRLNNPDLEILENRLCLWDKAEDCAVFESGMSAISTVFLTFLRPDDAILHSAPVYGGTDYFMNNILTSFGINVIPFYPGDSKEEIIQKVKESGFANKLKLVYIETPANPTNFIFDIAECRSIADEFATEDNPVYLTVDNTYLGPIWQHPIQHGADIVVYSATKYIGGHSDVIAGACLGTKELVAQLKGMRTFLGNMAGPWTGWLLMRSLETLKVRMDQQAQNAEKVAEFLTTHHLVEKVHYLGLETDPSQKAIIARQVETGGAMISFNVKGGEKEAFKFLNSLKLIKLAVSLGSTESLAEHPATMTHIDVDPALKDKMGITENLVRISVGVEFYEDIIADVSQALECVVKELTPVNN